MWCTMVTVKINVLKYVRSLLACNIISKRGMPTAFAREYAGILESNIDFEV